MPKFLSVKFDWDGPVEMCFFTEQRLYWPFRLDGSVNPDYENFVRTRHILKQRRMDVQALSPSTTYIDPRRERIAEMILARYDAHESFVEFYNRALDRVADVIEAEWVAEHRPTIVPPRAPDDIDEPPPLIIA